MGARTQLTFGAEPIRTARFLPGNPQIVFFLRDIGGGEFFQVYRLDRTTGKSELLTDGKSRHEALTVSADGQWIAYAGTGRNGKDTDVYLAPTQRPREARRLTELAGTWYPTGFSRDGKRLLVMQFRAADDSDLHVVEVQSGQRRQITPGEGKGSVHAAEFTADGNGVFVATDRWSDFARLYVLDLNKGPPSAEPTSLTAGINWNVEGVAVSADGRNVALEINEDGYSRIYVTAPRGGKLRPMKVPNGVIGSLRFPKKRSDVLALSLSTSRQPQDVYTLDLRTGRTAQWTRSEVGGLDTSAFVEPELVRYPSTDGVVVPAFLYRPAARAKENHPVVVVFHGGPEAQSGPGFKEVTQFLVAETKMAVLVPNVRGSEGYGKTYRAMDDGVRRERSLADIGATLDFIAQRPDLDETRVGVYGGSYGGYMTLAAAAFFPERVRAAVDIVGISSIGTFMESTQAYRRDLRRDEYGDERVPEVRKVQERISPLNSVDKIQAALFVQQGKNDPRVPQSEAEQIVKAVRGKGRDVWYALAVDEGHGFAKKANRDFMTLAAVLFLEKHLSGAPAPAPAKR